MESAAAAPAAAPAPVRSVAGGLRAWITSGACQSAAGAIVAFVDEATGRHSFDYAEITGYGLTFLAGAAALSDNGLAVGRRAASWLVERLRSGHLMARDGWDNDAVYLFDLGIIASGLINFGRRIADPELQRAGVELVAFLDRELAEEPFSALAQGSHTDRRAWSTHGVAHLAKLGQSFLLSERYAESAHLGRLIDHVKRLQQPDGRMPTVADEKTTMLHPHLYAAEGLWMWGTARADVEALAHARAAVEWAWAQQLENGGFPRFAGEDCREEPVEQCDVTSQAIRMALVFGHRTPAVERAVGRLSEVAIGSHGTLSLPYQPAAPEVHLNTWATLFGAQALALAVPGAPPLAWGDLV
jgi:hypothetical protein